MYRVRIEQFEGPLDLLLFFIRRDELDIYDIPVARITDEYLQYVHLLKEIDLDVAADFIYTAALLIRIKAQMLLPRPEVEDGEEPEDPRKELVERLLEYVRYKETAERLEENFDERSRRYMRGEASDEHDRLSPAVEDTYSVSLFDLMAALKSAVERVDEKLNLFEHGVIRESYSIVEQREWLVEELVSRGESSFVQLMEDRSKPFIIVTFLALLELLQSQRIALKLGIGAEDFRLQPLTTESPEPEPVAEVA